MIESKIQKTLEDICVTAGFATYPNSVLIATNIPRSSFAGDFAIPCFNLIKDQGVSPSQVAEIVKSGLKKSSLEFIQEINISGGYVNITIDRNIYVSETLCDIYKNPFFGSHNSGAGKKVLVEHTSINPNASPHMGRARNAIIGDSIVRLLKFEGYDVKTHYFVNDIGKQIALLAHAFRNRGPSSYADLLQNYVNINEQLKINPNIEKEVFKLLNMFEKGDLQTRQLFKDIVSTCLEGHKKILAKIGVNFDCFDYESDLFFSGKVASTMLQLERTGHIDLFDGQKAVNLSNYDIPTKTPHFVLTRSDGTSLYPLRDLAYTIEKIKSCPTNIIILGEDQKTYYQQIAATMNLMGLSAPEPIHYSFVLLPDGKMSTRNGRVVLLDSLFEEVESKVREKMSISSTLPDENVVELIARAAIRYNILKVDMNKNVIFDADRASSFEGSTGPYMLYTIVRAKSILNKTKALVNRKMPINYAIRPEEFGLCRKFGAFPNQVQLAIGNRSVANIANYAMELAKHFSGWYSSAKIIGSPEEPRELAILETYVKVMSNALNILGIMPVEKM